MRLLLTLETELTKFIWLQVAIGALLTYGMIRELTQRIYIKFSNDRYIVKG